MTNTIIRHAARELSPTRPIAFIAETVRCPRPTAKSWYTGHRRSPIWVLELLRDLGRMKGLISLERELEHQIRKREYEPKRRTGFWIIDPLTGQNKSNRRGRPKRTESL
jgi:hypothetical protein